MLAGLELLAGCATPSLAPAGWQPLAGAQTAWTSGGGSRAQSYVYLKRRFEGSLNDLASQEAVNVVLRHTGARFVASAPFKPCPGQAAVATFRVGATLLAQGFAVENGDAVEVTYVRPNHAAFDPVVRTAMIHALCVAPL